MEQPSSIVTVGDVIVIPEGDYLFGQGALRLLVTEPPTTTGHLGSEWLTVTGREIWYDRGEPREGRDRTAIVRVTSLVTHPPRRFHAA
ncbi:hypothetical protein [Micromonospora echinofusca]|uniref:Uncharacterized protein n=1 Tax=Micromonospora echinofusca TaxID=47858 RepID=A0ABS3VTA2_MICEH|nr:hypothetical protein [Micromonospora echinofusca]MBO4207759.1 hypothetical protein [Micromonospora echinofusca]